ncbi:MAG TPA: TrkH family potassium uptake protein, partial [Candidatus Copromorpha excrementigallinarum]|nr:TrkH family potassium uptake protein [Candidatus Copromorpha excrementigallinarum]
CLGNVGPGFDLVGPTQNFSHMSDLSTLVLSIYMIAGRLELYTLFIVITPRFWNPDR